MHWIFVQITLILSLIFTGSTPVLVAEPHFDTISVMELEDALVAGTVAIDPATEPASPIGSAELKGLAPVEEIVTPLEDRPATSASSPVPYMAPQDPAEANPNTLPDGTSRYEYFDGAYRY